MPSVNWGFPEPFVCTHPSGWWEPFTDIVMRDGHARREVVSYRCGRCKVYIPKEAAEARLEEEANGVPDLRVQPST